MNMQEAFDKVWQRFVVERQRRGWDIQIGRCCYRTKDGASCTIGCLIPDEIYSPAMEGYSIDQLVEVHEEISELFKGVDVKFLIQLQDTHDNSVSPAGAYDFNLYMEERLRIIAHNHQLTIPSTPLPTRAPAKAVSKQTRKVR